MAIKCLKKSKYRSQSKKLRMAYKSTRNKKYMKRHNRTMKKIRGG